MPSEKRITQPQSAGNRPANKGAADPRSGRGAPAQRSSAPGGRPSGQRRPGNHSRGGGRPTGGPRERGPRGPVPTVDAAQRAPAPREPEVAKPTVLELPPQVVVRDLATQMGVSPIELIKQLMNAGIMANINQLIDYDTAAIVAEDMGFQVREYHAPEPPKVEELHVAEAPKPRRTYTEEEKKGLRERPPVVTILGHVDHGKTSLLDAIRTTNVQSSEAGGITQHIGAYQIQVGEKTITFLDTPGHAAFTAMRARGASVTDIAILVVAADDGVQPQTKEAIDHARAAGVPIIVALNKIDLPSANPDLTKQQLADVGLVVEDWGGDTICVPVSARQKTGLNTLVDMILLVSEMAELRADPKISARGTIIEARLDRFRGPTATVLVQDGTLKEGDVLLVGHTYGRMRAMFDFTGQPIKRVTPSMPAVVIGLKDVPEPGDTFEVREGEKDARDIAEQRALENQAKNVKPVETLTLEEIYKRALEGDVQSLNLILKADVQGSLEPIKNSLEKIDVGDLKVRIIHQGVGNIGESDVMLAVASQAIIIGFNVTADAASQRTAEVEGVSIRTYDIIYRVIEDVQLALTGMLKPEYQEVLAGRAVVREVFNIPRLGKIAGVQITEGKALRSATVRVKRNDQLVYEGRVGSLKRFTEDVREVNTGFECGVSIDGFSGFEPGDTLEFCTQELVERGA
jgi:translation initiation factor IF-2